MHPSQFDHMIQLDLHSYVLLACTEQSVLPDKLSPADSFPNFSDEVHHPKYDIEISLDQAADEYEFDPSAFRLISSRDANGLDYLCQIPLTTRSKAEEKAEVRRKIPTRRHQ